MPISRLRIFVKASVPVTFSFTMADEKVYVSYDDVHRLLAKVSQTVLESFKPDFIIAIGGGGFIPGKFTL